MPMRSELPVRAARMSNPPSLPNAGGSRIGAMLSSPEFLAVALFCTVGLWLTAYFIHYFPDFGAMAVSLEIFP